MTRRIIAIVGLAALLAGCSSKTSVTTDTATPRAVAQTSTSFDPCGCPAPRHHLKQLVLPVFAPAGSAMTVTFTATDDGPWEWDWDKLVLTGPDGVEHHAQRPAGEPAVVPVEQKYSSSAVFPLDGPPAPGLWGIAYDGWNFVATKVA